jgi:hypothetical protein
MTEATAKMVMLMAAPHNVRNAIHFSLAFLMKGKTNEVIVNTLNTAVRQ